MSVLPGRQRAFGYLASSCDEQLASMPGHLMSEAWRLRVFRNKVEKFVHRPKAVAGITLQGKSVFLWVSEAPGGVLACVTLPMAELWRDAHYAMLGAQWRQSVGEDFDEESKPRPSRVKSRGVHKGKQSESHG